VKTPKQQLLETLYPGVAADVQGMRELGISWRTIAEIVSKKARVDVSLESLRNWYNQPEREAS
jgi:hypothetical protein